MDTIISTDKLVDLAVTVEKNAELWSVVSYSAGNGGNNDLDTAVFTELAAVTVDVPSWAGQISISGVGVFGQSASGAGLGFASANVRLDDAVEGEVVGPTQQVDAAASEQIQVVVPFAADLAAPGSTVAILFAGVPSGATHSWQARIVAQAIATR